MLLIVTYRSPWLWLVPLTVVGTADLVSNSMIAVVSRAFDMNIDASTTGIVDVLVFGAGTNYALLLIARYREELRRNADRREAMRRALGSAGPAIAASAATVALSLLTLVAAVLANERAIGVAGAVGITVAALYGLVVLPAALTVCGRGLFWPFVPRPGQPEPTRTGVWARIGTFVSRRPVAILTGTLVLLALLASGLHDARLGLSRTEQFRVQAESDRRPADPQPALPRRPGRPHRWYSPTRPPPTRSSPSPPTPPASSPSAPPTAAKGWSCSTWCSPPSRTAARATRPSATCGNGSPRCPRPTRWSADRWPPTSTAATRRSGT